MIGYVLCHGWGFTPFYWEKIEPLLAPFPIVQWNLGYFGPRFTYYDLNPNIEWVGIGHSLGFATLALSPIRWKALVSIAGFAHFCPQKQLKGGTSPHILTLMKAELHRHSLTTLKKYYERHGLFHRFPSSPPQYHQLLQGLDLLLALNITSSIRQMDIPLLALAAKRDPIVPFVVTKNSFGHLPSHALSLFEDYDKHLLGYDLADECVKAVARFLTTHNLTDDRG